MSRDRMPSISTVMRYVSPEAIAERRRKARENFGRVTPVPSTVAADAAIDEHADSDPTAPERTSGPSPWAQEPAIDKAALPSSTVLVGSEPKPPPSAVGRPGTRRARSTWIVVGVCVFIGIVGPLSMVALGRMRDPAKGTVPGSSAPATATPPPSAAQGSALPARSADPAPEPSATPDASAAQTTGLVPAPAPVQPAKPTGRVVAPVPRAIAAPRAVSTTAPSVAPAPPPIPPEFVQE